MLKEKPQSIQQWQQSIYEGTLYKLPGSLASQQLANDVNALLHSTFGIENLNDIHNVLSEEAFFASMKIIRKTLFEDTHYIHLVRQLLLEMGFEPGNIAFEPLRLRAIRHNGHLNERAKAVYYPHRDTWYGHSQSLIVGWIPLHDQNEDQTFEIYPEYLQKEVPNNSEIFDYDYWRSGNTDKKIGWQKKDTGLTATYPEATQTVPIKETIRFSAQHAENLIFSGAHFHKTLEQSRNLSRFSIDYRFVSLQDHKQKLGAPNVDNRSRGSALQDYLTL